MAFQPIFDISKMKVTSYEALVRHPDGSGAWEVLSKVTSDNQYKFDQACREKAIEMAAKLNIKCHLSINFMPNAVYEPNRCLGTTLAAAKKYGFPIERIVFEFTECEEYKDIEHIQNIVNTYQKRGFTTAIDDFGDGYSGLKLASLTNAEIWKIDISLIRDIDKSTKKQSIVKGIISMADEMNIRIVAEGIETEEEFRALIMLGIIRFQGYFFAKPKFEGLPSVDVAQIKKIVADCHSTTI